MTTEKIVYPDHAGARFTPQDDLTEEDDVQTGLTTSSDAEWIEQLASGEAQAFESLYRRHAGQVHRVALRIVGSRADADDITQRVFEKAWLALPRFRAEARVSTWLYRVTVNACLDHLRAARRRPITEPPATHIADPRRGPEALVASAQTIAVVEQAILRLPDKYRIVIVLRDIEGHDYKSMRAILRLPVTTLKMRVVRGREYLSRIIERMGASDARR